MSSPNHRFQHVLSRLQPFHQLDAVQQASISLWKDAFKEYDEKLRACLKALKVAQLEPYLTWIHIDISEYNWYDNDIKFRELAQGGFAKVFEATVKVDSNRHHLVFKELKYIMIAEVRSGR